MNEGKGNKILLTIIAIATLLVSVVGATFAYFTAVLSGTETEQSFEIKAGSIGTEFVTSPSVVLENIVPQGNLDSNPVALVKSGETYTKQFGVTVTNESSTVVQIPYRFVLKVQTNSFAAGALHYTLAVDASSSSNGTKAEAKSYTALPVNITSGNVVDVLLGTGNFVSPTNGAVTHTYNLNIYFPETNVPQNENQGKLFEAYVHVDQEN